MEIVRRIAAGTAGALVVTAGLVMGGGPAQAAESHVVTVTPSNMAATGWQLTTTGTGTGTFVTGPAKPPLGVGSFQLTTAGLADSVTMFNAKRAGTTLPDITAMRYYTYRSATSTNPAVQAPSYQVPVKTTAGFTTLVWEPVYNPSQGPVASGVWQRWDAYNGGAGIWWSTHTIPGVCAQVCSEPWSAIVAANPTATIYGVGFKAGSGWSGSFTGNVDAFSLGVSGRTTTYNFEPNKAPCKDKGGEAEKQGAPEHRGCASKDDGHSGDGHRRGD